MENEEKLSTFFVEVSYMAMHESNGIMTVTAKDADEAALIAEKRFFEGDIDELETISSNEYEILPNSFDILDVDKYD